MNKLNERVSFPSSIIAILNDEIFQLCGDEFLDALRNTLHYSQWLLFQNLKSELYSISIDYE
jgi:hypothetical protein